MDQENLREDKYRIPCSAIKGPLQILEKYKDDPGCQRTACCSDHEQPEDERLLKGIASLCEIKKHLTTHTARTRRTYATTVCHESGVAIENISKMLGHTDTRMTDDRCITPRSPTAVSRKIWSRYGRFSIRTKP